MKTPRILAAFALVLLSASALRAATPPLVYPNHVMATAIADQTYIRGGRAFTIGIYLQIEPGWHIYWTNPGDTGLATTVEFKGPEGFEIAAQPFPIPRKIRQGKENVYGYETPVCFTARVTPPADLRIGDEYTFEVSASWLICKEECLPGKMAATLTMKVADRTGPKNVDAFQRTATTVAGAKDRLPDVAGVQATIDNATHIATLTLHWKNPVTGITVFPGAVDGVKVSNITVKKTEDDLTPITMKIEIAAGEKPAANRLPLLISFRGSDGRMVGLQSGVPVK